MDVNSEILGDGSFSVCRRCIEKSTGKEYAVKIVSRKIDSSREINLLKLCQGHPNIVQLHQVFYDEVSLFGGKEDYVGCKVSTTGYCNGILFFP